MKKLQIIVPTTAALLLICGATFAHTDHKVNGKPARKEQKAWGIAGEKKQIARTIRISMTDEMRFVPDQFDVKQGETVRIELKNTGKVLHEMVIGTKQELDSHAALMMKFPDMEHDEPHMVHVAPGKTGEIIWKFNNPGQFDFACLIPGHYQTGMVGKINVLSVSKSPSIKRQKENMP